MRRSVVLFLLAAYVGAPGAANAYLKLGVQVGSRVAPLKWNRLPVHLLITDRGVPGVTSGDLQASVSRAAARWQTVPTSAVTLETDGLTRALPGEQDGQSTIGFIDRPDLDRVLGATSFVIDRATGELLESDIFFNAAFPWTAAASGEPNRYDLESIALHELGHLVGLSHSALGETEPRPGGGRHVIGAEAVMFPIAFAAGSIAARELKADDIAGVSDIYPDGDFASATGRISGRVTKNGTGLFGAHVIAFHLETGRLVANFTLTDGGDFVIAGLQPGPHVLRVEPLDDADVESFFDRPERVDLNFRVTYADRVVFVPAGGTATGVDVAVAPK